MDTELNPARTERLDRLLKINDVCELLGLSRATIYRWMRAKPNPFPLPIKLGGASRWTERQISEWRKGCEERQYRN